ncbi:MAG: DUF2207 domain-containing protein [Actinomycetota bacterium]
MRMLHWPIALILFAAPLLLAHPAAAQFEGFERITDYSVKIEIDRQGDILVTEVIDYDFGSTPRHGIFRDIPVRLRFDERDPRYERYDRVFPIEVQSVEGSPGTPDQYTLEDQGPLKRIKIGDPDETITGEHTYTIAYKVQGALNGFKTHDELYWNAIGADWNIPIERAEVEVSTPSKITAVACFAGPVGSTIPCDEAEVSEGTGAVFKHKGLFPYSALTIVVGFRKGAVPPPKPILDERWSFGRAFEVTPATGGITAALLVLVIGGFGWFVWKQGRDRRFVGEAVDVAFGTKGGPQQSVPLFESSDSPVEFAPPDNLRPGQVGTLVDEMANPLDVTATIVDLAVRGYMRIEEIPKEGIFGKPDWKMAKLKAPDDLLTYERVLFNGLFKDGDEVKLSELRNEFASKMGEVQESLYADAMKNKWFAQRPDKARTRYAAIGGLVFAGGVILLVLAAVWTHLALLTLPIVLGGLLLMFGRKAMPRRTAKGTGVLRRTLGFKYFIDNSEKERARFAERANIFSEYLPFAIVFGATKKWAKAFEGLDADAQVSSWYVSSHPFVLASFSDSIDGFSVTTAGTLTSTPAGSGSSGFSGGGGSSGGGGGGGGGGSW